MEFKINVDELQSIFSSLSNIVRLNEDGIAGMILMDATNELKFKAASGNIKLSIDAKNFEIIEKGKALVRFIDLKSYVMKFVPLIEGYGTENYHFVISENKGLLKTKTSHGESVKPTYKRLKFRIYVEESFPPVKEFEDPQLIVNSSILKRGIGRVLHCVNPGEIRKAMAGINVTIMTDKIVFVGTNGIKLSEFALDINADIENKSHVLTYNFASVLRSILDDDAQVFIKFEGSIIYIRSNNIYISGSLVTGESYPDYKPMFNLNKVISIPRLSFYDSVHTVMDVLDPEDNHRLSLCLSGNKVVLKNDKVESEQESTVTFEDELDIDINGEFLDSLLKDFMSEFIEIHFTPENNYVVFKSADDPNQKSLLTIVRRR